MARQDLASQGWNLSTPTYEFGDCRRALKKEKKGCFGEESFSLKPNMNWRVLNHKLCNLSC